VKRLLPAVLACGIGAWPSAAADSPGPLRGRLIGMVTSSSGRIGVGGLPPATALEVALLTDRLLERMERAVGGPLLPVRRKIVICVSPAGEAAPGGWRLRWDDAMQRPVIDVLWGDRTGSEDILEALGAAVLEYRCRRLQTDVPRLPWWAGCGFAHYVRPQRRMRDFQEVLCAWEEEVLPPLADLLQREDMLAGRWLEKSMSGVLFAWIAREEGGTRAAVEFLTGRAGADDWEKVLADRLAGGDRRRLRRSWDLFVAGCAGFQGPGRDRAFALRRLRHALRLDAAQLGALLGRDIASVPTLGDLAALPAEERRLVSAWLQIRMQQAIPGAGGPLRELIAAYRSYFTLLSQPRVSADRARRVLRRAEELERQAAAGAGGRLRLPPPAPRQSP